jgi:hypothetical protein
MTIEVRQLLIKSQVGHATPPHGSELTPFEQQQQREQVKQEILAECKAWLARKLAEQRER